MDTMGPERRLAVSLCSPRPPPQRTGGRRSRARHMAPSPRGFGPPVGGGGRPETGSGGTSGPERGSSGPAPAPARSPRHSPEGLARWRQRRRRQPSAVCDRLSLPPCLPSPPRCTLGNAVPPEFLPGIGAPGENYSSRCAMRRGPATARSAGGEAKPGREAARASP